MASYDLTVRGAGIFGLSIAWTAIERGARVRVVDPNGVAAGASGGIVGALQPHVPESWNSKKAFQLESLLMAGAFWSRVEKVSGQSTGYAQVGRLQPLRDERDVALAEERAASARKLWPSDVSWRVIPSERVAWQPPSPTGLVVHDTLSAILHPRRACGALAAAIRARGGDIVDAADDSGKVIWCTGWRGLQHLSASLGRPLGDGVKGQALALDFDARGRPQVFADGIHFVPHLDGTLAIGSTSQRAFDDADSVDEALDELHARAIAVMPAIASAPIVRRWAGVRPRAATRAPLMGAWPGREGHFVANGGFKIGFGMAPKVAEVMVGLLLDGQDAIPDDFRLA